MMMKRTVTGAAMVLAVLVADLAGQAPEYGNYKMLAGCSEEPTKFHPCALEKAKTFNPPRTPQGTPDFSGFWSRSGVSTDDLEEHPSGFSDPGGRTFIIDPPSGKVPYQAWAAALKPSHVPPNYRDTQSSCFVPAPPRQAYTPGGGYQILHTPGAVTFLHEFAHAYRHIPTDGRPHIGSSRLVTAMGDSRGRWEGNTLVVDVTNLRAQSFFDHAGNFYSSTAHIVERWTMIAPDAIHYVATIEDPRVYTRPWTIALGIRRNAQPGHELMEVACFEGERTEFTEMGLKNFPYFGVTVP